MSTPSSVAGLPVVVRITTPGPQGKPGNAGAPGCATYPTKGAALAAAGATPPTLTGPTMVFIANDETINYTPTLYHYDGTKFRQVQNWPN